MDEIKCPKCGTVNPAGITACVECGASLEEDYDANGSTIKLKASMAPSKHDDIDDSAKKRKIPVPALVAVASIIVIVGIIASSFSKSGKKDGAASAKDTSSETTAVEAVNNDSEESSIASSEVSSEFASTLSDIREDKLNMLSMYGADIYKKSVAANWKAGSTLKDIQSVGYLFLTNENEEGNKLYLIYKVTVKNEYVDSDDSYSGESSFFWYTGYKDIVVKEDGSLNIDFDKYEAPAGTFKVDSGLGETWSYDGWKSTDEIIAGITTINPGFDIEDHIDKAAAK
ncbi:MAG: zinc ribbon domain-containing protein [Eubacterium sp.]|nr:zinc ribbon domain-containing protein [Eubacterium sp.]